MSDFNAVNEVYAATFQSPMPVSQNLNLLLFDFPVANLFLYLGPHLCLREGAAIGN